MEVITPNPRPPAARWNFLAAWAWAKKQYGSDEKAKDYVQALYKHVPVLDTGARGSTITFVNNQIGDAAGLGERGVPGEEGTGRENFEIVVPSISILAEPPVVVDKVVEKERHPQGRRGLPCNTCTARKASASPRRTSTGRATRRSPPSSPRSSRN